MKVGVSLVRFAFVILHYFTFDVTNECIESIISNIDYDDYSIIVVDNNSPNDSGDKLIKKYCNNDKVICIKTDENLGFARGNNIGYSYAKKELNSDFIVMINNDVTIEQKYFLKLIKERYESSKFDIMGPDILCKKNNIHQNPFLIDNIVSKDKESVRNRILENKYMLLKKDLRCIIDDLKNINDKNISKTIVNEINSLEKKLNIILNKRPKRSIHSPFWRKELENVKLHGCCFVFSPDYVKRYKGLYDKTFMYGEEEILYYIAQKEKLKLVYYPKIQINHKMSFSTNIVYDESNKKQIFMYEQSINSYTELLKIMEDENLYKDNIYEESNK